MKYIFKYTITYSLHNIYVLLEVLLQLVDVDECLDEIDECNHLVSDCVNALGSYSCACHDGYRWNEEREFCEGI